MLDGFMNQLAKDMELKNPFKADKKGVYTLPLDYDLSVRLSDTPTGFIMTCDVGENPKGTKESDLMLKMMLANVMGQGTNGAVLGFSMDTKIITLSRSIDYRVEYKDFQALLETFLSTVDFWHDEILQYQ